MTTLTLIMSVQNKTLDTLPPLRFTPIFLEKIWGGDRLRRQLGKSCGQGVGESWELSSRPEACSVVAGGEFAGLGLDVLCEKYPREMLGGQSRTFPLLFKYIDANDTLSLQVHPRPEQARTHGTEPKNECWYILEAEPGAHVYLGLSRRVTVDEVRAAILSGHVEDLLNRVPVRRGDFFHVVAGTVHATGKGVLFAEIQQNSDTTYRLYDWSRVDRDGKPRELHLDQGLEAMSLEPLRAGPAVGKALPGDGLERVLLANDTAFRVELWKVRGRAAGLRNRMSFSVLQVVDGAAILRWRNGAGDSLPLRRGDTVLLPASLGEYEFESADGATLLQTSPSAGGAS